MLKKEFLQNNNIIDDKPKQATILLFPKNKIVRLHPTIENETIEELKRKVVINKAEEIVESLTKKITNDLRSNGIELNNSVNKTDYSFAIDAIRSTVYRSMKLDHQFHNFVDNMVVLTEKDEMEMENQKEEVKEKMFENLIKKDIIEFNPEIIETSNTTGT